MTVFRILVSFLLLFPRPAMAAPEFAGSNPWGEAGSTLEAVRRLEPSAYEAALSRASIEETADRRSFVVWHAPKAFDPARGITLVTLHGRGGLATTDFEAWEKEIKRRGWAHMSVQWWYGRSADRQGFAQPDVIYRWVAEALERHGVPAGRAILQGFSMGGAASFPITALDRLRRPSYFAASISNAGPIETEFPFDKTFLDPPDAFAGSHWILYCGLRDEVVDRCCERMVDSADAVRQRGGAVDLLMRDPDGKHSSFMRAKNLDRALDAAEENIGPV